MTSWYSKERQKRYDEAKAEGRLCEHCGWIVPKHRWVKEGKRLCFGCEDALKGVSGESVREIPPDESESEDITGEA